MRDISDSGCPPVYHTPGELVVDVLCRIMWVALGCYDETADYVYGHEHLTTYRTWTDYDEVDSFEVVRITPDNAVAHGYLPTQCGLKVRYDTHWVADVDTLADARTLIGLASGTEVALVPEDSRWMRRWVPGPAGGVGRPVRALVAR
ncbi:MAG TPA: hypothetical protein VFX70_05750 [Mycobacteriales bacterium]|nr:hypothetical protein [Mycobacteriales bacterium]